MKNAPISALTLFAALCVANIGCGPIGQREMIVPSNLSGEDNWAQHDGLTGAASPAAQPQEPAPATPAVSSSTSSTSSTDADDAKPAAGADAEAGADVGANGPAGNSTGDGSK